MGKMAYKGNMKLLEAIAERQVPELLSAWLGVPVHKVPGESKTADQAVELLLEANGLTILAEVKSRDTPSVIDQAQREMQLRSKNVDADLWLLVVPYMGKKAREYARKQHLSWIDLSGNANIQAPGIRVLISGEANKFAVRGRPTSLFSPKATRLTRVLLVAQQREWRQAELVKETGLSAGFVSKLTKRMLEAGLLRETDGQKVKVGSYSLLLDSWRHEAKFSNHHIERYHASGRTGPKILYQVARRLSEIETRWACTGLSTAWLATQYADFRLSSFFVEHLPNDPSKFGLRPVERGENVWLVIPNDLGVFYGCTDFRGIKSVHPVQAYIDLEGHPERSEEAAEQLRSEVVEWAE